MQNEFQITLCEVGSGFRVQSSEFRVQGSGFRVQGSGFRVTRWSSQQASSRVSRRERSGPPVSRERESACPPRPLRSEAHMETLVIYKLGSKNLITQNNIYE